MGRRIVPSLAAVAAAALVAAGALVAASGAQQSGGRTSARALIAQAPGGSAGETRSTCPPCGSDQGRGGTERPGLAVADGASATRADARGATATASARDISLLGGLITADEAQRQATITRDGTVERSGGVTGLKVGSRRVGDVTADRQAIELPDGVGTLTLNAGEDAIRVTLARSYQSLAPGAVLHVARVQAHARAAPTPGTPRDQRPKQPGDSGLQTRPEQAAAPPETRRTAPAIKRRKAPNVRARLTGGGFVFPAYGDKADFSDDYGAPRKGTGKHAGNDIFAPFGAPVLAVTDGSVEKVGTLKLSGNRLWLVTRRGDAFFYAHMSAFSPAAVNGRRVKAGTVLGFTGNTGDAEPTPSHLHFEVHPGGIDQKPVDPFPFLRAWREGSDVDPSAWLSRYGNANQQPGALLEIDDYITNR